MVASVKTGISYLKSKSLLKICIPTLIVASGTFLCMNDARTNVTCDRNDTSKAIEIDWSAKACRDKIINVGSTEYANLQEQEIFMSYWLWNSLHFALVGYGSVIFIIVYLLAWFEKFEDWLPETKEESDSQISLLVYRYITIRTDCWAAKIGHRITSNMILCAFYTTGAVFAVLHSIPLFTTDIAEAVYDCNMSTNYDYDSTYCKVKLDIARVVVLKLITGILVSTAVTLITSIIKDLVLFFSQRARSNKIMGYMRTEKTANFLLAYENRKSRLSKKNSRKLYYTLEHLRKTSGLGAAQELAMKLQETSGGPGFIGPIAPEAPPFPLPSHRDDEMFGSADPPKEDEQLVLEGKMGEENKSYKNTEEIPERKEIEKGMKEQNTDDKNIKNKLKGMVKESGKGNTLIDDFNRPGCSKDDWVNATQLSTIRDTKEEARSTDNSTF